MPFDPVIIAYRESDKKPFTVVMENDFPKSHSSEQAEQTLTTYMRLYGEHNVLVLRQVVPQITYKIAIPPDESE
ncbi:MAG TPA: hypothetical protein VLE93_03025 [Candidatus Saccharimonadales bacterium]|nr:hypothetical protein [Candidatus Saccharimonadales bacterium]